ncbi:hypothetical protein NDU88_003906 [Pleurodeles waltl]|uniref:Uncharacterized protein n=1 Tax=Pleurodeles waltl TaxID=8319 RepID=A0AAV7KW92_PLEWA|nr:hypothetical protein NDU88_003906 [Pleurodeles waltl]
MSFSLSLSALREPGQGVETNFLVKTPRFSVSRIGSWAEAACLFHRGKRYLTLCCLRGPRFSAAFNIFMKKLGKEAQARSKYYSAISVGGSLFMIPVKLRVRASSRDPPLAQKQKYFCCIGEDEEALQKAVISNSAVPNKGGSGGSLRFCNSGHSGQLTVVPEADRCCCGRGSFINGINVLIVTPLGVTLFFFFWLYTSATPYVQ